MKNKVLHIITDKNGVSLVEVMIALVVLLLVFMGILQAALLGIDHNMRNILRDEAIKVAAMRMEEARSLPFDNVVPDPTHGDNIGLVACQRPPVTDPNPYPVQINRDFRNIQNFPYGTRRIVNDLDADTKRVQVLVRWEYRDECYTHSVTTLRRR
jgi:prepilin-type N-terminal cleavage/methylation domain-containing protein